MKPKPWFEQLASIPPKRLRLFALKGPNSMQRLKSRRDIARDGGLAVSTVSKISKLDSWETMPFKTIVAYIRGCGVDPLNLKDRKRYFQRADRKKAYLTRLNPAQRRMLARVV
jgi:hypothetical protein